MTAVVMDVYKKFFGVDVVTPHDDFFELGGHSLLAMQIVNELNSRCGSRLNIRDLFGNPEPASLGKLLAEQCGRTSCSSTKPASDARGAYPLSHAQQRLYVLHRMEENGTSYNIVSVFLLRPPLDPVRLETALHALARRQDTLRTVILEQNGALWQQVRDDAPVCRFHTTPLPEREACAATVQEALEPFDPARGMLRLCIRPTTEGGQCLALGMHHLLGDGWSLQILFGELMALYEKPDAALPALPIQYRDYALSQQNRDWSEAETYWRGMLRDLPDPVRLPADAPAGTPGQRFPAGAVTRMVAQGTVTRLRSYAAQRRISLATCILSLFAALISRLSRQPDMLIGMGAAGRERAELEGLIGFFVNILPIRVRIPASGSLDELMDSVNTACQAALAHQDYPFDLLVRDCVPRKDDQHNRQLVNVMFEYQRYSDLAKINTLKQNGEDIRIVDEEEWMPLIKAAPPARYDLTVYVQDEPQGCRLRAEYDSGQFTPGTVSQWLAFLELLMDKISGTPEK